jgi:hypothetical protein
MDPGLIEDFKREYPDYTSQNLCRHGVYEVQDSGYLFVDHAHPAVALVRASHLLEGVHDGDLLQCPWVRLGRPAFYGACQVIRDGIFAGSTGEAKHRAPAASA